MAEITSTPDDPSNAKRLAYQIGGDFPPPRSGYWFIVDLPVLANPELYWVGRPADVATAIPPEVRHLMTVQRTLHHIRRGYRLPLKCEPKLHPNTKSSKKAQSYGWPKGPMYWLCSLANYGCYLVDKDTGGFSWIELPMQPRLEPELSKRLLATTRQTKTTKGANNG
jgi:hypothetical protein